MHRDINDLLRRLLPHPRGHARPKLSRCLCMLNVNLGFTNSDGSDAVLAIPK